MLKSIHTCIALGLWTWVLHTIFLSSDIRSERSILQSSKNSTSIFLWFSILHHSHILKKYFRKNVCVCVCVCVCPSPNVEPKAIYRSRSKSISRALSQISRAAFFSFPSTPKIKGSLQKKKIKNFDFLKNESNDFD